MGNDLSELSEIAFKYGSDRCPQNGHTYTEYYFDLLKDKREDVKKVLEIGIGNGSGLMMWREFFPNAKIYGVDNRGRLMLRRNRIASFHCDQRDQEGLKRIIEKIGRDIDLVIDDGSGRPEDQLATCLALMPHLQKSVTYIIEDAVDPGIITKLDNYDCEIPSLKENALNNSDKIIRVQHRKKREMVSILVPSRNESFEHKPGVTVLQRTVQDVYEKATGKIEVIVGFDGPPYQEFPDYPNLKTVKFPQLVGIKTMVNALAAMAQGKYIYKTDSHCSFGKGFDEILQDDIEYDWIVMPRFYVLNGATWEWQDERFYDYFFLCCPFTDPRGFRFKAGGHWPERTQERLETLIDETPQIHGSGWFMTKDHYFNGLGGFPNIDPYGHAQEPIWLALKNWLGGGKVMVNKKTWYAHMHQQGDKRGYNMSKYQTDLSYKLAVDYWLKDSWAERKHDFAWFVDRFMPMPTWPENWKEIYENWRKENS